MEIDKTLIFGKLELQSSDAPKKMRWKEAVQYAIDAGNDWRLPSSAEFKAIRTENKTSKLTKFQKDYYWCSEEVYPGSRDAIAFHMGEGKKYEDTKTCLSYVRLVKNNFSHSDDPAGAIALHVSEVLINIIKENKKELSEDFDFKVLTHYGYGKFYLGKLDGSYDMSFYSLVHYILYQEKLYPLFLNSAQLKDLEQLVKNEPEAIYRPKEDAENFDFVQYEMLDHVTSCALKTVRDELEKLGHSVQTFDSISGQEE